MSHSLTIDVPEDVFSYLNKLALQQGKTPETLAQELVSTAVQELEEDGSSGDKCECRGKRPSPSKKAHKSRDARTKKRKSQEDPLLRWAGAIDSEISDVAERHDYYIGQALYRELRGNPDE